MHYYQHEYLLTCVTGSVDAPTYSRLAAYLQVTTAGDLCQQASMNFTALQFLSPGECNHISHSVTRRPNLAGVKLSTPPGFISIKSFSEGFRL